MGNAKNAADAGSIHRDHRKRVREKFGRAGLEGFTDIEALEFLLFFSLAMKDTNVLAHRLIERFGSLAGVFDAPAAELVSVEGVGEQTATLITLVPQLAQRYLISRSSGTQIMETTDDVGEVLVPYFFGKRDEVAYILCLDAKLKVLGVREVGHGTLDSANVSARRIVETALGLNAAAVVLAHNHPSGNAMPSDSDRASTAKIAAALETVGIRLLDHLVVADGDYVSMQQSGFMRY